MKQAKFAVVSLVVLAAASAATGWAADEAPATRAEVKKEYLDAKKAGTLPDTSEAGPKVPRGKSDKTRMDVKKEYSDAKKSGTLPDTSEAGPKVPRGKGDKSRADVRDETRAAAKAGKLPKISE